MALLIGLAISRAPAKPKVAIVNLSPPSATVELGGTRLNVGHYYSGLFSQVQPVPTATRAQAVRAVKDGRVLAAVVIPANIASRLSSVTSQGQVEVIYNGEALEQSFVHSTIEAAISQANLELSNQIRRLAAKVIGALVRGGSLGVPGAPQNLPGLSSIPGHPAPSDRAPAPRGRARAAAAARGLLRIRRAEPGHQPRRAEHCQPADPGAQHAAARPPHAAGHLRGGGGGQHLADVRVRAARRRGDRAGARRAHALAPGQGLARQRLARLGHAGAQAAGGRSSRARG